MPRSVTIVTPENVRIDYELAGVASRAGAAIVDTLLQGLLLAAIGGIRLLLILYGKWPGTTWAYAVLVVAGFLVFYGYFVFFETVWNGQTPGKRSAAVRAVREGGMPMDLTCAAVRNLVRIIDFLPSMYIIGAICVLVTRDHKRLGDFAAGTIVVKERHHQQLPTVIERPSPEQEHPESHYVRNIELIAPEEFKAVKAFVERRAELRDDIREHLAQRIAAPIVARLGIEPPQGISYSSLLAEIYNRCTRERGMR